MKCYTSVTFKNYVQNCAISVTFENLNVTRNQISVKNNVKLGKTTKIF